MVAANGRRSYGEDIRADYYLDAGKRLKSTTGWNDFYDEGVNGTDDYGFSAMPGGEYGYNIGSFDDVGDRGYWWSATEIGSGGAYFRNIDNFDHVFEYGADKERGFSVRCVRN
jgi:uncharacterized protein (TIGR02145 family)